MTGDEMRATLKRLGWSQTVASVRMGLSSPERVSEWCLGLRRIPPYIAVSLRNLERLEMATDLVPSAPVEPESAGAPHPRGPGPIHVSMDTLRQDGHRMRRHAYFKRRGTGAHRIWHVVCECGWISAKTRVKRDLDTLHVAHLRQIIAEWEAEQASRLGASRP